MKEIRILHKEVSGCFECPCLVAGQDGNGDACYESGDFMPIDNTSIIPNGCPLKRKE